MTEPISYREYVKVIAAVAKAKRHGKLPMEPCEVCGAADRVHGHHDDYSKPLEIRWLCPKHHRARHKELGKPLLKTTDPGYKLLFIRHIPPDLHHLIKMQAVKEHKTMEQYILNALANAVTRAK